MRIRPANRVQPPNRLLAVLPRKDRERFLAVCDLVELNFGEVLGEPGERVRYVYFPTASYISLVIPIDGNENLEVGMIGNEGMFGIDIALGVTASSLHALVQGSGSAWRIGVAQFRRQLEQSPALRKCLNRYAHVLMSQLAQTAACTRFHFVEARLARWLLMTGDRAHSNNFRVTHEFLAWMLGVRRVGITTAAGALQRKKLLTYRRGDITILDRRGLEAASCGCYQADKVIYRHALG